MTDIRNATFQPYLRPWHRGLENPVHATVEQVLPPNTDTVCGMNKMTMLTGGVLKRGHAMTPMTIYVTMRVWLSLPNALTDPAVSTRHFGKILEKKFTPTFEQTNESFRDARIVWFVM